MHARQFGHIPLLAGMLVSALFALIALAPGKTLAGEADVLDVALKRLPDGRYEANVTLRHADQGWQHFADRWEIVDPGGKILATRVLRHPHREQPFTRRISAFAIPEGVEEVRIRAHDSVHEYGGAELRVAVPRPSSGSGTANPDTP